MHYPLKLLAPIQMSHIIICLFFPSTKHLSNHLPIFSFFFSLEYWKIKALTCNLLNSWCPNLLNHLFQHTFQTFNHTNYIPTTYTIETKKIWKINHILTLFNNSTMKPLVQTNIWTCLFPLFLENAKNKRNMYCHLSI